MVLIIPVPCYWRRMKGHMMTSKWTSRHLAIQEIRSSRSRMLPRGDHPSLVNRSSISSLQQRPSQRAATSLHQRSIQETCRKRQSTPSLRALAQPPTLPLAWWLNFSTNRNCSSVAMSTGDLVLFVTKSRILKKRWTRDESTSFVDWSRKEPNRAITLGSNALMRWTMKSGKSKPKLRRTCEFVCSSYLPALKHFFILFTFSEIDGESLVTNWIRAVQFREVSLSNPKLNDKSCGQLVSTEWSPQFLESNNPEELANKSRIIESLVVGMNRINLFFYFIFFNFYFESFKLKIDNKVRFNFSIWNNDPLEHWFGVSFGRLTI